MGYRLVMAICALVFMCSCSAFDKDTDAIEGFGDSDTKKPPSVAKDLGPYSGYYEGTMTLDSNTCKSVSDSTGVETRLAIDVVQSDSTVNVTFEDDSTAAGTLSIDKVTIMTELMGVRHIYYFAFSEENKNVEGSCEVIEADESGQYGDPCASYTIALEKGEKPEEHDDAAEEEENKEEEAKEEEK